MPRLTARQASPLDEAINALVTNAAGACSPSEFGCGCCNGGSSAAADLLCAYLADCAGDAEALQAFHAQGGVHALEVGLDSRHAAVVTASLRVLTAWLAAAAAATAATAAALRSDGAQPCALASAPAPAHPAAAPLAELAVRLARGHPSAAARHGALQEARAWVALRLPLLGQPAAGASASGRHGDSGGQGAARQAPGMSGQPASGDEGGTGAPPLLWWQVLQAALACLAAGDASRQEHRAAAELAADLLAWAWGAGLADAQTAAGEQLRRMQAEAAEQLLLIRACRDGAAGKRLAAYLDVVCALAGGKAGGQVLRQHGTAAALQRMRSAALAAAAQDGGGRGGSGGGGAEWAAADVSEALLVLEACSTGDPALDRPPAAAWDPCAAGDG